MMDVGGAPATDSDARETWIDLPFCAPVESVLGICCVEKWEIKLAFPCPKTASTKRPLELSACLRSFAPVCCIAHLLARGTLFALNVMVPASIPPTAALTTVLGLTGQKSVADKMDENLDENGVHELEEVLHTKIYPGTEIMRDIGAYQFVKGSGPHRDVLVPQPSDDAHDPLNWSPLWKGLAVFCATVLSFALNLGPLANSPMFDAYMAEWPGHSLADMVQFTGVAILCMGFSNIIWVPLMVCFGRRSVAVTSILICTCSAVWRARATSYESFMGASVLNGLAAGPCGTLMPQVIVDVIFLHERGRYQTLYFSMYFSALMVGPTISGAMTQNLGWRSFWWFYTGLLVVTLLVNVFLFPETRYRRVHETSGDNAASVSTVGAAVPGNQSAFEYDSDGKKTSGGSDHDEGALSSNAAAVTSGTDALSPQLADRDAYLGRGRPGKTAFLLWQPYEGSFLLELWLPLCLYAFPIAEFAAFVVAWTGSCYLVTNLTQTQVFTAPPYGASSGAVGLYNLALLVGALFGLVTCGPLSDWVAARLTARNGGVREPEMRLPAMIPYAVVMVVGSVVTAVGYQESWAWQAIVVVGYGFLGMQVATLPAIVSTYAVDSYKPATGSMFVMITINKNVWGYAVGKFITPWTLESGFVQPILINAALCTLFCLSGLVFWFYGKALRGLTAKSFVHRLS